VTRPAFQLAFWAALLAGLLPIIAAHASYLLNLWSGSGLAAEFVCMPYVDGCVSVSRAARSGSGLTLFRWVMLPSAALLLLCWFFVRSCLGALQACSARRSWVVGALGMLGAVFLVLYVTALGNEDDWYRWQRRYGVILYFGGTAMAQLLLVWTLWPLRRVLLGGLLLRPIVLLTLLVSLQWALGVFSSFKRLLFEDPVLIDRIENVIEWWYALAMSLAFVAIAWLFRVRS
jgi:hypothetical protein